MFVLKEANPARMAIAPRCGSSPADGSAPPRRLTLGAPRPTPPRWSPDGATLAFLSDRTPGAGSRWGGRPTIDPAEDRPTATVARPRSGCCPIRAAARRRQLTRLPEDVTDLAWSPDGDRLCVVSAATSDRPDREAPDAPTSRPIGTLASSTGSSTAQWGRVHLRQAAQPVARGRSRRARAPAHVRREHRRASRLEPRRPADRVRVRPPSGRRTSRGAPTSTWSTPDGGTRAG